MIRGRPKSKNLLCLLPSEAIDLRAEIKALDLTYKAIGATAGMATSTIKRLLNCEWVGDYTIAAFCRALRSYRVVTLPILTREDLLK